MSYQDITEKHKNDYNKVVSHPLQSYEWGEFRKKTGVTVIRKGLFEKEKLIDGFTMTLHPVPKLPFTIGYLPKGNTPSKELLNTLIQIGKEHNCIFIQLEPNVVRIQNENEFKKIDEFEKLIHNSEFRILNSQHPLFTKYTFILDLTPSEEELLKRMHSKTRYNIRVAQKHGVEIIEDNSEKAFEEYLKLTRETTTRQNFYAHTESYHKLMWETLRQKTNDKRPTTNSLSAHLFLAKYQDQTLAAWVLFTLHDTLFYPYGSSSSQHREVMASNLMMWEAIKFGKKLGLKKFDMWGSLGPEPDTTDPWYGFHKFKQGYGGTLTEFVGSYDLIINPLLYQGFKIADKARWTILRLKK